MLGRHIYNGYFEMGTFEVERAGECSGLPTLLQEHNLLNLLLECFLHAFQQECRRVLIVVARDAANHAIAGDRTKLLLQRGSQRGILWGEDLPCSGLVRRS